MMTAKKNIKWWSLFLSVMVFAALVPSWCHAQIGADQNSQYSHVSSVVSEKLEEIGGKELAGQYSIKNATSSHGQILVVPGGSNYGTSQFYQNNDVIKAAENYATQKYGSRPQQGQKGYDEWNTLKQQGLIEASKNEELQQKVGYDAQIEKCKELTGKDCRIRASSLDQMVSGDTSAKLYVQDGLFGTWKELDESKFKDKRAEIEAAGEFAIEQFKQTNDTSLMGYENISLTDANGREYVMLVKNGHAGEVVYGENEKAANFKGCEALPVKLYKQRKCFFCPLFAVIYSAADQMTALSFEKLAPSFAAIIALGLGIWIAFQTLTHVSSLTKQDAPKFLGNLIKQSFKFLIAFLLLQNSHEIFTWIIIPLLKGGLEFGNALLFSGFDKLELADLSPEAQNIGSVLSSESPYYTADLYVALEAFITSVQREIAFMQAIGTSLMCIGGHMMMGIGGSIDFGSGFQMAIQGFLLAAFGLLLSLAFAFYMVDAVVQLGIVGALLPFLIASWPFKLTAQYASTGFKMLLNSFFVFAFTGLVVTVNLKLIDSALTNTSNGETVTFQAQDGSKKPKQEVRTGALQDIYKAINAQEQAKLKELTDISAMGFLILIICCIFGFKFSGQASELAGKMGTSGMKPLAPGIGTMGSSAALSAGKKLTQPTRRAISDKVEDWSDRTGRAVAGAPMALFKKFRGAAGGKDGEAEAKNPKATTPTKAENRKRNGAPAEPGNNETPVINQNTAPLKGGNGTPHNNTPQPQQSEKPSETPEEAKFGEEFNQSATGQAMMTENPATEQPVNSNTDSDKAANTALSPEQGATPNPATERPTNPNTDPDKAANATLSSESSEQGATPNPADPQASQQPENPLEYQAARAAYIQARTRGMDGKQAEAAAQKKASKTRHYQEKMDRGKKGNNSSQNSKKSKGRGSTKHNKKIAKNLHHMVHNK